MVPSSSRRTIQDEAGEHRQKSRRRSAAITIALLSALFLFAWFTLLRFDPRKLIGKPLPDLAYLDLSGSEKRLANHDRSLFLLVAVRVKCKPCSVFLQSLYEQKMAQDAQQRLLVLYLEHPDSDKLETVKNAGWPFPAGFVKTVKDAARLQVVVVPTVFLVEDGLVRDVAFGLSEPINTLVARFRSHLQ
ncbi:MAG: hypothetical protein V2G42_08380 [bacterium JZ-2024 1]